MNNTLPEYEFFTGVPGSRWSGLAQEIKLNPAYNTSDRAPHRVYTHGDFAGHKDSYFGTGMEFSTDLNQENLDAPFSDPNPHNGTKLLMSHEWPYHFESIMEHYPAAWITLVYRPGPASMKWWLQAGGFDITYPNYDWYQNESTMGVQIYKQNKLILDFAQHHSLQWTQHKQHTDILVATYQGKK